MLRLSEFVMSKFSRYWLIFNCNYTILYYAMLYTILFNILLCHIPWGTIKWEGGRLIIGCSLSQPEWMTSITMLFRNRLRLTASPTCCKVVGWPNCMMKASLWYSEWPLNPYIVLVVYYTTVVHCGVNACFVAAYHFKLIRSCITNWR
jgi:hypothetical protein